MAIVRVAAPRNHEHRFDVDGALVASGSSLAGIATKPSCNPGSTSLRARASKV